MDWAYTVAISVFAFSRNGAAGVGLVTLIRLMPAAASAPFTAALGDRFPRRLLLVLEELIIGLILATTAIVTMVRGPDVLVYGLAVAQAIVSAPFRAYQGALLPTLAQTPDELTASNLVGSAVEAAATAPGDHAARGSTGRGGSGTASAPATSASRQDLRRTVREREVAAASMKSK